MGLLEDEIAEEQAYVDLDVTLDHFNGVVSNITSCNNLSFSNKDFPNHNMALHISLGCKENLLSNLMINSDSSSDVILKSTLSKLAYGGTPMRYSHAIVKAFDGSKKSVVGEVYFPIRVGPHVFHIALQVMDICPTYNCLLGHQWILEVGAATSTLHKKVKFVKDEKLVLVNGEQALLISHLSSFCIMEADEVVVGTVFQALPIDNEPKKAEDYIASFKDA